MSGAEITLTPFHDNDVFPNYNQEQERFNIERCLRCQVKELTKKRIVFYSPDGITEGVAAYAKGMGTMSQQNVK